MPRRRAPLRENAFRIGAAAVGALIGLTVVLVFSGNGGHHGHSAPPWAYVIGAAVAVVVAVGAVVGGLGLGRLIVGDHIEAALREPGGRWRHGRFTITGDSAVFERYRFQMRIPSGRKVQLSDVRLGDDTGERPPMRQLWTINPQLHIVSLDAREGHYEMGALPSRIEEFRDRLGEAQPTWPSPADA